MAKKPSGAKPPKTMRLPHVRASNYREVNSDGALHRVDADNVILTFYINDVHIKSEQMSLIEEGPAHATYRSNKIDEERQRLDVLAVRIPWASLIQIVDAIRKTVTASDNVKVN